MRRTLAAVSGCVLAMAMAAAQSAAASDWPVFGQSVMNQASSPDESTISTANVATLAPKWSLTTTGYVSARAAVVAGVAYFPDSGGTLWAVNTATGSVIWSKSLTADYGFAAGTYSRTSPAVDNGTLFIGTQLGAYLLAIDTATGNLLWSTQMDQHPLAIITSSPVVSNGVIYGGVASLEQRGHRYDPKPDVYRHGGQLQPTDRSQVHGMRGGREARERVPVARRSLRFDPGPRSRERRDQVVAPAGRPG
jgi:polyvinyl alcohol dehydrogenase (cytochrome)